MVLVMVVLGVVAVALASGGAGNGNGSGGAVTSTAVRAKIVSLAESQVGYHTDPPHSYCNKFSAFWGAGTTGCAKGLRSEEWCADFAAWTWYEAGAQMTYAFGSGDINGAAASFYAWAAAHGTWHPAGPGYVPQPGDVAVYGLRATGAVAAHVAVVTGYTRGARGPNVVDGDGDRTGFSVVESVHDQYRADVPGQAGTLSGYASPIVPQPTGQPAGGASGS